MAIPCAEPMLADRAATLFEPPPATVLTAFWAIAGAASPRKTTAARCIALLRMTNGPSRRESGAQKSLTSVSQKL
jgi:hypothetical protein